MCVCSDDPARTPRQRPAYSGCPARTSSAACTAHQPNPGSAGTLGPATSPGPTLRPPMASRTTYPGAAPQELRHPLHGTGAGRDGLVGLLLRRVPKAGRVEAGERRQRAGQGGDGWRGRPWATGRGSRGGCGVGAAEGGGGRGQGTTWGGGNGKGRTRAMGGDEDRSPRGTDTPTDGQGSGEQRSRAATGARKEGENDTGEVPQSGPHPAQPWHPHHAGPLVWGSVPAPLRRPCREPSLGKGSP